MKVEIRDDLVEGIMQTRYALRFSLEEIIEPLLESFLITEMGNKEKEFDVKSNILMFPGGSS